MRIILLVALLSVCGKEPEPAGIAQNTCLPARPSTCEAPFDPPDAAPQPTGAADLEVAVNLPASSNGGAGRLRYWVSGDQPVDLYVTVKTLKALGPATGAFFVDGVQVPVRVDGGDPVLTFPSKEDWMTVELAAPPPPGVSLGSLVFWLPDTPRAAAGHSLTLIHDGCDFATDIPKRPAEIVTRGMPTLTDPDTGTMPLSDEFPMNARGGAPVRVCAGGAQAVTPQPACDFEDYLVVALVDGKQGLFDRGAPALRYEAVAGTFAEAYEPAFLSVSDDLQRHQVVVFELPSYRRFQTAGSLGTEPVELGRYRIEPVQ